VPACPCRHRVSRPTWRRGLGKGLPYLRNRLPSPPTTGSSARYAARRLRPSRRAVRSFTTAASSDESW
jgi:hypothetical protein